MFRDITSTILTVGLAAVLATGCDIHGGEPDDEPEPAPPLPQTVDVRLEEARFAAFRELLGQDWLDELRGRESVTLFAPENGAIDALPDLCITRWLDDGRMELALRHQIVLGPARLDREGLVFTADSDDNTLPMSSLQSVVVEGGDVDLRVDGRFVGTQLEGVNGFVHPYVGEMLLPPELQASVEAGCRD